ncbi:hypothetical protein AVDCRST_MAG82-3036 [uncultured Rubrobacteraceae bacterium]|uniref:Uncharacterized protein n=1 Tax=uncultured Rubrobacteraceae bacterium TaxID=349277 RepID=A0A6J4QEI6_9ACTN|nr:hypothetical protein AVDCRST_MAG82-3036 [uncultured Rubrobacteraceae bacterium]
MPGRQLFAYLPRHTGEDSPHEPTEKDRSQNREGGSRE